MSRTLLALALLAFPPAAAGQIVHDVAEGVWFIGGTDGPDSVLGECDGGLVKANGTDPASGETPCTDVEAFELDLRGGVDFAFLLDLSAFSLDPLTPSTFDGGADEDYVQIDVGGFPGALRGEVVAPPTGPPAFRVGNAGGDLFEFLLDDPSTTLAPVFGPEDDVLDVLVGGSLPLSGVQVFGGGGNDVVDGTGTAAPFTVFFIGGPDDDMFLTGGLNATLVWDDLGGTDRIVSGTGPTEALIFGDDDPLGLHLIRGFLDPTLCAIFDFNNGGGIVYDDLDTATFSAGPGGLDLFAEVDCDLDFSGWDGDSGLDRSFLRGGSGGGNRFDVDFLSDTAIFSDGFESGDTSSWSTGTDRTASVVFPDGWGFEPRAPAGARGGTLWDGIDYQDWPSFAAPATSGPSTVVIRGKPDFPVTLDLGPDGGGTGFGDAVDTLLVDPKGLPFTDDGSTIVIDGGPPITYAGAEVVRVGAPVAAEDGPEADAPTLAVFPNPTAGAAAVRLSGAGAGAARVTVVDVLGREVTVLHDGPVAAGARTWAAGADRLAPGRYLVRAVGDGWSAVGALAVVR